MAEVPENRKQEERFIVVREYSHTDRQKLYKVMSRDFQREQDAESWMSFLANVDEPVEDRKYLVVQVVAEMMSAKPKRKKTE